MMAEKIPVIIAGMPGDMGSRLFAAVQYSKDFEIPQLQIDGAAIPVALTGDKIKDRLIDRDFIENYRRTKGIYLGNPANHSMLLDGLKTRYGDRLIGINFADAAGFGVNNDFVYYNIPFLYGGTGAKKEQESELVQKIQNSKISAGIVKNFAVPVLSLIDYNENYAMAHKEVMRECVSMHVKEDHQSTKKDPSGTAIRMSQIFGIMCAGNCPFDSKDIREHPEKYKGIFDMIRDPEVQRARGVPEEHINGHGHHEYTLKAHSDQGLAIVEDFGRALAKGFFTAENPALRGYTVSGNSWLDMKVSSADNSLYIGTEQDTDGNFALHHNINGRQVYVDGVMQRGLPLLVKGEAGKVYFEADVLKAA